LIGSDNTDLLMRLCHSFLLRLVKRKSPLLHTFHSGAIRSLTVLWIILSRS